MPKLSADKVKKREVLLEMKAKVDMEKAHVTSFLEFSSRRNSKTLFGGTGNQKEVAALRTMPGGLPGSPMLFLVITLTSSASFPDIVHVCAVVALTPAQKLTTILSANFSMLLLPSGLAITGEKGIEEKHKSPRYQKLQKRSHFLTTFRRYPLFNLKQ